MRKEKSKPLAKPLAKRKLESNKDTDVEKFTLTIRKKNFIIVSEPEKFTRPAFSPCLPTLLAYPH